VLHTLPTIQNNLHLISASFHISFLFSVHSRKEEMASFSHLALPITISFLPLICQSIGWPIDPTHGFTQLPFNTSFYHIQKPYNLPETDRYSFFSGIHKLWVYSTDEPLSKNSPTKPRTEIIISVEH
jgi:hypothetical protein